MKNPLFAVYEKMPIAIQNLAISLYGVSLYRQRYGKFYKKALKDLAQLDYSDAEQMKSLQNERFLKFLTYAVNNSAFYKDFYDGVELSEIKSIKDIQKLPILEKECLRENLEQIYTIDKKHAILSHTGGTTGKSLEVRYTLKDMQERMAYLHFWESMHGVSQGERRASFNGRQFISRAQGKKNFWRYNYFRRQMLYSTFNITEENLPCYIESLNQFKPVVINGFVSAIFEVANYINNHDITLEFKPKVIFTTSETLLPYQRNAMEKAFGCPVRDQYASSEGAPLITECKCGKLHYNLYTGIIEEYQTEYGTEMLVTGFNTHGTPLIRYRIGDMWELSEDTCECGCCFPVVKRIEGRKVDYLLSKQYGKVSLSHLADVIKGLPNSIINMQFIQRDISKIEIKIIVDKNNFTESDKKKIIEEMIYRFGDDMQFDVQIVDEIAKEKSGKYSLIKNEIQEKK